ncbi:MAG: bifunctional DNA-formamidopyrimidine glycosylase/DNA-(apurinic or apyrimidinic site) lyase [Thermoanaerobaculia bacterium]
MPELPEIEIVRRTLVPRLEGRRIVDVLVRDGRLREPVARARFARELPGRRIERLGRRAKYLLVELERDRTLVFHLGMSGRLTWAPRASAPEPHEHLALDLDNGGRLRLRDPRRFGLALLLASSRLPADRHFRHLGPEPLEASFDGMRLAAIAERRRGPVKGLLMDATAVVGVGNIYACEALHRASIHPRRSVARIARPRWERLAAAVREVLEDAIRQGGTTLNDFADGNGESGYFQVSLAVYGREGEPCPRCGRAIRRVVQSGRSTFYCPGCQT